MRKIGWLGSLFFSASAVPLAYDCWIRGNADHLVLAYLIMWLLGVTFTLTFVVYEQYRTKVNVLPLIANYIINLLTLLVILYFKFFPTV